MTKWGDLNGKQLAAAEPSKCKYCGDPIYWELLPKGKKAPIDAGDLERHRCNYRKGEK